MHGHHVIDLHRRSRRVRTQIPAATHLPVATVHSRAVVNFGMVLDSAINTSARVFWQSLFASFQSPNWAARS